MVEYTTDFYVLRPQDPSKGTGRILYEVNNRGRKMLFGNIADGPQGVNDPKTMNGYIADRGTYIGVPAPTHAKLTEIVKKVERREVKAAPALLGG